MRPGLRPAALLPVLLLALALAAPSCGYKTWPKPIAKEDRFEWESVSYVRSGNCLEVAARVKGQAANLDRAVLQLQSDESGCPGCPFNPDVVLDYGPGAQGFKREGQDVHVTSCALTPGLNYRFRLAGVNVYTSLGLVLSPVLTSPAAR